MQVATGMTCVAGLAFTVWCVWLGVQGDKALSAARQAHLEECRVRLRDQPARPIAHRQWMLNGPSNLIWGWLLLPAFFVMCWVDLEILPCLLALPLLAGLYARQRSRIFELVVEGTSIRWGWADRRDSQQTIDLRRTLSIAHARVEATGSDSGSYSLALVYSLEDGTYGSFPGADNLLFVREFLAVVNEVRPGVAPRPVARVGYG
jgi:hypothetical protein